MENTKKRITNIKSIKINSKTPDVSALLSFLSSFFNVGSFSFSWAKLNFLKICLKIEINFLKDYLFSMKFFIPYLYLLSAVILGSTSNSLLKLTGGFTKPLLSTFCSITIVLTIFFLSKAMANIPVGFTYATYGGLTITAVTIFGIFKYNQIPNFYGIVGLVFIIVGVILVNYFGKISVKI